MKLERTVYYPLQTPLTGVFFASVGGGSSVPTNALLLEDSTPFLLEDGTYLLTEA